MQHEETKGRFLKQETINHMYQDKDKTKQERMTELLEGRRIVDEDIKQKRAYDKKARINKKLMQE